MNVLENISKEELIIQKQALAILKCDKVKLYEYIEKGKLRRIKSNRDKRYTYYLKSAVEELANKEEFYYQN